jgi:hypothetical protein
MSNERVVSIETGDIGIRITTKNIDTEVKIFPSLEDAQEKTKSKYASQVFKATIGVGSLCVGAVTMLATDIVLVAEPQDASKPTLVLLGGLAVAVIGGLAGMKYQHDLSFTKEYLDKINETIVSGTPQTTLK